MDDDSDKERAVDLRDSLAMLALLEISSRDVKAGRVREKYASFVPVNSLCWRLRKRTSAFSAYSAGCRLLPQVQHGDARPLVAHLPAYLLDGRLVGKPGALWRGHGHSACGRSSSGRHGFRRGFHRPCRPPRAHLHFHQKGDPLFFQGLPVRSNRNGPSFVFPGFRFSVFPFMSNFITKKSVYYCKNIFSSRARQK